MGILQLVMISFGKGREKWDSSSVFIEQHEKVLAVA